MHARQRNTFRNKLQIYFMHANNDTRRHGALPPAQQVRKNKKRRGKNCINLRPVPIWITNSEFIALCCSTSFLNSFLFARQFTVKIFMYLYREMFLTEIYWILFFKGSIRIIARSSYEMFITTPGTSRAASKLLASRYGKCKCCARCCY